MQLPIGILIYWVNKLEDDYSVISSIWYFKEFYVPSNAEEKKRSLSDLKAKRCRVLNIHGRFEQIVDIISQCDRFIACGEQEIQNFRNLIKDIENNQSDSAYLFDDIYDIKGTSLMVDMFVEVEESLETIQESIRKRNVVDVNISGDWSLSGVLLKAQKIK